MSRYIRWKQSEREKERNKQNILRLHGVLKQESGEIANTETSYNWQVGVHICLDWFNNFLQHSNSPKSKKFSITIRSNVFECVFGLLNFNMNSIFVCASEMYSIR